MYWSSGSLYGLVGAIAMVMVVLFAGFSLYHGIV